jgi:hypothetical protein
MVWTEEESRFLRAVMSWDALRPGDQGLMARSRQANGYRQRPAVNNTPPVGEFRILVIGAKGTGKTSILTRVRGRADPLPRRG